MANVTGEAAEEVSSYMTAIWNNFADDSHSLEHYADVITALGAATASSSEEIAEGLEKFASVGKTVGLSYDYATSALATVVANTRQSADVVGTAFKTLFARIQDLELGETLDDGTTLGTYSQALEKVGINIKDQSGELKEMDEILNEMGAKWKTLSKDQQVSLAQSVAGTRQYTQLVALMAGWDDFQKNLTTAQGAEGSLQEQADIYAESWEAARDRVTAAAQEIYSQLLNDKFFIGLNNALADLLELLSNTIDTLGGLPGVLALVTAATTKLFSKDIAESISTIGYNFLLTTEEGREHIESLRSAWNKSMQDMVNSSLTMDSAQVDIYRKQYSLQEAVLAKNKELAAQRKSLNEYEQIEIQNLLEINKLVGEEYVKASQEANQKTRQNNYATDSIKGEIKSPTSGVEEETADSLNNQVDSLRNLSIQYGAATEACERFTAISGLLGVDGEDEAGNFSKVKESITNYMEALHNAGPEMTEFKTQLENLGKAENVEEFSTALDNFSERISTVGGNIKEKLLILQMEAGKAGISQEVLDKINDDLKNGFISEGEAIDRLVATYADLTASEENGQKAIEKMGSNTVTVSQKITAFAQTISTFTTVVTSLVGVVNTLKDPDLEPYEKALSLLTTAGMVIPMVVSGFQAFQMLLLPTEEGMLSVGKAASIMWSETLGPALPVIAAVGVAVAALVATATILYNTIHANEIALKEAQEAAENATEYLNNVKDSVSEVKSKLEELANTYDTFSELTKGTTEWYDAIAGVNAQVAELLKTYPELRKYITNNGGMMVLSEEGQEYVTQQENKKLNYATNYQLQTQKNELRAERKDSIYTADGDVFYSGGGSAKDALNGNLPKFYSYYGEALFDENSGVADSIFTNGLGFSKEDEGYKESFQDFIDSLNKNADAIREATEKYKQEEQISKTQLEGLYAENNSDRTAENSEELGISDYDEIFKAAVGTAKVEFSGDSEADSWNKHIDYKEGDSEFEAIEDFIKKTQPDGTVYAGQKNGKAVFEDSEGKEVSSYTFDEFMNQYAQVFTSSEFESQLAEGLETSLGEAVGDGSAFKGLDVSSLVSFDNLKLALNEALNPEGEDDSKVNQIFSNLVESAGTSEEKLEEFATTFEGIDWSDADNIRKLNAAAESDNIDELTRALEEMQAAADLEGMASEFEAAAEKLDLSSDDAEVMEEYARILLETDEALATNAEAVKEVSIEVASMNKGIEDLADGIEEWASVLSLSSEESMEFAEASLGIKKALGEIFNIESDLISTNFAKEHLEEIQKAATGDEAAIESLRAALKDDITTRVTVDFSEAELSDFNTKAEELQGLLDQQDLTLHAGMDVEDESAIQAAAEIVSMAKMTADEANAYFASIGYEPLYSVTDVETENSSTGTKTTTTYQQEESGTLTMELPEVMGGTREIEMPAFTYTTKTEPLEAEKTKDTTQLVAISGDQTAPEVKGLRKTVNASSSNYSSKNSGGKSSGSSSSSSSKPSKKDHKKHTDKTAELYHDVNEAIKKVEHEVSKLDSAQEHLAGNELIASLKTENLLLSQQRANYAELNREIEERQSVLRGLLSQYGDAEDYYTTYNNIQAAYNSAVDQYNALIDSYNAMTKTQQEAQEDALESAEESLENQQEAMEKALEYLEEYYSNKDDLRSNDEQQQELLYQQIENNLEAYETEITLKLDTTEAERSLAEFLKNMKTDIKNLYKTSAEWAEVFEETLVNSNTHSTDVQTHLDQLELYKEAYRTAAWGNEDNLFASESETIQAIVDAEKQLLEDGNTLLSDYEDAYSNLGDAFSEAVSQFDDIIDDFERINDVLDHYQKINELLYGESKAGRENSAESYIAQAENSIARQSALNSYIKALEQRRLEALASGYDEDDDYIRNIDDEIESKTSDLESTIEDYIDTIQSQLENTVQMVKETLDEALWGGSISDVQQEWDDKTAMAEGYYDEVERIYQLESLENKWQSAINSTDSLKAQQKLKDLMDAQVSALEDKTALSEKDIELAEKEMAVYQAQIALEEAQNSKDSMKLVRDESGNWSYQYVADEENVAEKQQDYLDKLNEYRTSAINATTEIEENILNAYTDFTDRMTEIMSDVTLSEEERNEKINELTETYYGEDGIITKAVEDSNYMQQIANKATFEELWGLYQSDAEAYEQMTETEKELIDSFKEKGTAAYDEILEKAKEVNEETSQSWNSMVANAIEKMYGKDGRLDKSSVTGMVQQAYSDMQTALDNYNKAIVKSEQASDVEWSKVNTQLETTKSHIDDVSDAVLGVTNRINELSVFESKVLEIKSSWDAVAESIQGATADLNTFLSTLYGGGSSTSAGSSSSGSGTSSSAGGSGSGGASGDGVLSVGDTATFNGSYYSTSTGAGPTGSKYSGVSNGVVVDMVNEKYGEYSVHIHSADGAYQDLGWVKKDQLSGYDTGGYTGSWNGGDGRLALLHSKELVLNAEDTSNFLTAVSAVRDIANLGNITTSITSGVASLVKNMLGFGNGTSGFLGGRNNSQESGDNIFNINAEFPNANNAEEIREAIMSLPTLASQYLNRNNL